MARSTYLQQDLETLNVAEYSISTLEKSYLILKL
jgi:hypothetical protein